MGAQAKKKAQTLAILDLPRGKTQALKKLIVLQYLANDLQQRHQGGKCLMHRHRSDSLEGLSRLGSTGSPWFTLGTPPKRRPPTKQLTHDAFLFAFLFLILVMSFQVFVDRT
jgi:hypothetical protein